MKRILSALAAVAMLASAAPAHADVLLGWVYSPAQCYARANQGQGQYTSTYINGSFRLYPGGPLVYLCYGAQ